LIAASWWIDSPTRKLKTKTTGAYRKLVFSAEGDRLIGALLVGDIAKAGLYRAVIRERMGIGEIKKQIIDYRLHYGHLLCAQRHA
jgi:NAD(P)H-nitrite reductase large subunit